MTHAHRGGAWADHVLVEASECAHKPRRKSFSWPQAAALTLSALTADQALFVHAKLDLQAPEDAPKRVLITGAAGGVGIQLVSMAEAAGHEVFGLTSNRARDEEFITSLGAREVMEYSSDLAPYTELFDAVIDTVGGDVLKACWRLVKSDGALISIDSASWDFVKKHEKAGLSRGKENVKAAFFIVEPEAESMKRVGQAVEEDGLTGLVARTMEFERVREAYELVERGEGGRGKVVLVFE